ncbi:MAG TPA: hypothetical protein VIK84_04145 [Haloplasmataceae bacterium]
MNQQFEYYIKKIINRLLLQLIGATLLLALLIVIGIIFQFNLGSYFAPHVYILLGLLILLFIIMNYLLYKKQLWLIKNYLNDPNLVINKIKELSTKETIYFRFHLFWTTTINNYKEALEILEKMLEDENE